MSVNVLVGLLVGLSLFTYLLSRRAKMLWDYIIPVFYSYTHHPDAQESMDDEEHQEIHSKIETFYLQMLMVNIAGVTAVVSGLIFIAHVMYGMPSTMSGWLTAIAYSFILANYNINSRIEKFMRLVDGQLFTRIAEKNAEAAGYEDLATYMEARFIEERQTFAEFQLALNKTFELMDKHLEELGFDDDKDYTEDEIEEFMRKADEMTQAELKRLGLAFEDEESKDE